MPYTTTTSISEYTGQIGQEAVAELDLITRGKKPYLTPEQWQPVDFAARAPASGVMLEAGPLRTAFDRNIHYLNDWFNRKKQYRERTENTDWEDHLPASSEGRMLGGAAHTLRWGERGDMRRIVDTIVAIVEKRQRDDGYCMPFDEEEMMGAEDPWMDERKNYDRVNLTRGMVAAAKTGNQDALPVMRRFYDWLNGSPYLPKLLAGTFDHGSSHNCNNGHEGHLLMYFSQLGKPEDLVAVERYFVQDFFLAASRKQEAQSLSHYPFHVAHSYVLLAYKAWLDHFRATGAQKYLEAAKGAWQIVHDHFLHIGGTLAICEHLAGSYPPDSYFLHVDEKHHTGETCGSVFWADINHRLLQFFPDEAKYADQIEQEIFNAILAAQNEYGHIRYHNRLQGEKEEAKAINTCCEVMGSPFIASLPQYLYSIADDGLYINLFAPATITWEQAGQSLTLQTATDFPYSSEVHVRIQVANPIGMKLRIRVPGWASKDMSCLVNGDPVGSGAPSTFVTIDRIWSAGDSVNFTLPITLRTERYTGEDEDPVHPRYALLYGPILMALLGADDLDLTSTALLERLQPIDGKALNFHIDGIDGAHYQPYWQLEQGAFTCFPTMR